MSMLSQQVQTYLESSSWIRRMFEAGREMKAKYGEDQVYDFSLGNPDLPPPAAVTKGLQRLAEQAQSSYAFGYMPNAGYPDVRQALAQRLSREQQVALSEQELLLSCGAAGGLNVLFRAILEPGDEVVCPAPFFVEYTFYVQNHGGVLRTVPSREPDFALDIEGIEAALSEKTRIVLINSPNNPTGRVYSASELRQLAAVLDAASRKYGRPILLVSDEPYRFLTFDGTQVPPVLPAYQHSVVVSSFSKNLSLAGERVGYLALNPEMPGKEELMDGLVLTNRILGFVNAPALGQRLVGYCLEASVDLEVYEKRRAAMVEALDAGGYTYAVPQGAFYFFVQAPGGDDVAFVQTLQEERVLAVPGSGFGFPGYFRLSFCVPERVIRNGAASLARARQRWQ